jgi:hypothetical protein
MSGMSGLEHSSYECRNWRVSNGHKFNVLALERLAQSSQRLEISHSLPERGTTLPNNS